MGAKRWISVGQHEIKVSTVDERAVSPASSVLPYFVWSALDAVPTEFFVPGFSCVVTSADPLASSIVAPRDCTLSVATLRDVEKFLNGNATATLYVDNVATALAVTIDVGDTFGTNDVDTVAVTRGQLVQLICTANTAIPRLQCTIGML